MKPINADALETVASLCRQFQVERLELFGSGTEESFDSNHSDLDFLVEFQTMPPAEHSRAYFGLLFALEDHFGRPIDLVETVAVSNPYFLKRIESQRSVLYAA
jgi:predicted nucleotidyltransferase